MRTSFIRNTLILIATIFIAYIFLREASKVYVLNEENKRIAGMIDKLSRDNNNLEAKIELLKKDPDYVEKVAREELGMIKKNEKVYKFKE